MSVVKFSAGGSAAKMVAYLAHGRGGRGDGEGDEPRYAAWSNNLDLESPDQLTKIAHAGKLKPGELEGLRAEVQALVRWAMGAAAR